MAFRTIVTVRANTRGKGRSSLRESSNERQSPLQIAILYSYMTSPRTVLHRSHAGIDSRFDFEKLGKPFLPHNVEPVREKVEVAPYNRHDNPRKKSLYKIAYQTASSRVIHCPDKHEVNDE